MFFIYNLFSLLNPVDLSHGNYPEKFVKFVQEMPDQIENKLDMIDEFLEYTRRFMSLELPLKIR